MPTGAETLVEALSRLGVRVAFGLPGVHNLAAWKALDGSPIRLVGVRHEQAAAYAADGYARATGVLGVALTTTGPGAANTLGAVGEAWASGSPVLVIATDIPTTLRWPGKYRGALHETTDQAAMFAPVTKATLRVTAVDDVAATVERAGQLALSPPSRPVYVEIPTDLLSAVASRPVPEPPLPATVEGHDPDELARAVDLLDHAERPLVWAGGGALRGDAGAAVGVLAERLAAPVLTTYMARGLLGRDHPCDVGAPPHMPQVGVLWDEADVVVGIGTDFDGMMTQNWLQPQPPRLVSVNVDPADVSKNYTADAALVGFAAGSVAALAAAVQPRDGVTALQRRLAAIRAEVRDAVAAEQPAAASFLDGVAAVLPDDAVLVVDMCIPGYWLGGFHRTAAPRKLAYPVGWGTLGFAFPAALGTALAGTGPVVSVSGDGGFLFACGELATVAQEQIPLTAVIVDDGGYGMLRFDQRHAGDPTFGVDLRTPDFVALAQSFGVDAEAVDGLGAAFADALGRHVGSAGPSVLVARASLDPPPTTSPRWYRKAAAG